MLKKWGLEGRGLNGFQLKIIAIVIMAIDHTGALFFPDILAIRIVGRLAFPLFAFFIAEGYRHTRSVYKYLARLGICAVVFQIPDWFFGVHYVLNIFATLFFGLAAITMYDRLKDRSLALSWLAAAAAAVAAEVAGADYGAYGVFYMLVFFIVAGNLNKTIIGLAILHAVYAAYELTTSYFTRGTAIFYHSIQLYSMLCIPLVAMYNNKQGRKMKYFFYAFYPAHMIVLYAIDYLIKSL